MIKWINSLAVPNEVRGALISQDELQTWLAEIPTLMTGSEIFNFQSRINNIIQKRPQFEAVFDTMTDGGGGGGGVGFGGGFTGPVYRAPDERVVEDFVRGQQVSLLGRVDPGRTDRLVDIYFRDHRANFESQDREIDPGASVLEAIRGTEEYQTLHKNRPDSADERQWVSNRITAAQQGGLDLDEQEDFARVQAAVAGDVADVREAAAVQQTASSGSTRGTVLESRVKGVARALFQGVNL